MNQFVFFQFLCKDFAGLEGPKSYLRAFVTTNPQNELGDIISEPCVNLNRFRVIIKYN